jgi:hypothetical protein
MLLHRNQALFKVDKQQLIQPSNVGRTISSSVLDYMSVEDFVQHAISASDPSQSSVVPILSMLAGQLKGLRTLFSLHSYFISNEAPANILDRVRETALLILNSEDIMLIQLDEGKCHYVITHSSDRQLVGVVIGSKKDGSYHDIFLFLS